MKTSRIVIAMFGIMAVGAVAIPRYANAAGQTINHGPGFTASQDVYGNGDATTGYSPDGTGNTLTKSPNNNTINLNGSDMNGYYVYGGFTGGTGFALAGNNTVNIQSSINIGFVAGGNSFITGGGQGAANNNAVTMDNSKTSYHVIGGQTDIDGDGTATANNNTVTISGKSETKSVEGGQAYVYDDGIATSNNNTITIDDSEVVGHVYGASAIVNGGTMTTNNNTVSITGNSKVTGSIYAAWADGGDSNATVNNNTVTIKDSTINHNVWGGWIGVNGTATSNNNTVSITGSTSSGRCVIGTVVDSDTVTATGNSVSLIDNPDYYFYQIYGAEGYANSSGKLNNNSVVVKNTSVMDTDGSIIFGAYLDGESGTFQANNNTVHVENILEYDLDFAYGGFVYADYGTATANNNKVTIINTPVWEVYGGQVHVNGDGNATAKNNTVTIMDGKVVNEIFGGYVRVGGTGTATATHNTITIGGTANLSGAVIHGGFTEGKGDAFTGNTLNVMNKHRVVQGMYNFEYINFYLPSNFEEGEWMLLVKDAADITGSKIGIGYTPILDTMAVGDRIGLILNYGNLTADQDGQTIYTTTLSKRYQFDLWLHELDDLQATYMGEQTNPQTKALSEGKLGGTALVSQGADLVAGTGMSNALKSSAAAGTNGIAGFAAFGGGQSRYKTGSHVDVTGFSMMAGAAKKFSSLTAGAFVEAGFGSYDSFNSFNNMADVTGNGDTSYYGVGMLGRYDIDKAWYTEGSLRIGQVKSDFSGEFAELGNIKYDSSVLYYGAHVGGGYILDLNDKIDLDMSAKLFFTSQNGDKHEILGDTVKFDAVNSMRVRVGGRALYSLTNYAKPFAGLYADYELGGKQNATINGDAIDTPELSGITGIGELGLSVTPSAELPLTLDAGIQGYGGVRTGFGGTLAVKYIF